MNKVKRSLDNQAIGLVPLLLFMFLDNYFSYLLSFIIGVTFCFVCIFLFQILSKDKVYQFLLLPAATTLVLYSIFLCLRLEPVLFIYSPLITEVLLVVVLAFLGFAKRTILRRIRTSQHPTYKRTLMRTTLNEFFFVAQLIQNLYTLHLFIILVYSILPETMQSVRMERFLYRELGIVIGVFLILYEQIRISMMQGSLRKEMWLPVLNDGGKVIGCIARSVSRSLPKKYYHPVVRVAVIYQGMLYLVNRGKKSFVSPDTIDYPFYLSHGFIIFNPDVRFTDGYPGESCYNCVMPGITSLIAKGYVNEKAIGAQGHSWGGYQVAYLATRTRLFAAIESGAPVVNMLSAYGGIRWGSGLNRSMQYEHGQSRIGGNIWEMPLQYIENSPLFNMDKVTTPILIMHNDADGHVPWYQGIEYFIALKRLQKPAWLLNYTGEPHWPMRLANRIDFQKRMFQFFNHYLQNAPMPKWMNEGVPAVDQDFELGY